MKTNKDAVGGLFLVGIGAVALLNSLFDLGDLGFLVLPALALMFIVWGIFARKAGLFIPGGILAGVSLGAFLLNGPIAGLFDGVDEGAVFMLSFAAGWVLIPVLSMIFTDERHFWAFIPAGIMTLIGASLLISGLATSTLTLISKFWPLILILLGLYAIFQKKEKTVSSG